MAINFESDASPNRLIPEGFHMLYDRVFLLARNRNNATGKRLPCKDSRPVTRRRVRAINAGTLKILFKLLFVISSIGLSFLSSLSFRKQGYAFLLLKGAYITFLLGFYQHLFRIYYTAV